LNPVDGVGKHGVEHEIKQRTRREQARPKKGGKDKEEHAGLTGAGEIGEKFPGLLVQPPWRPEKKFRGRNNPSRTF